MFFRSSASAVGTPAIASATAAQMALCRRMLTPPPQFLLSCAGYGRTESLSRVCICVVRTVTRPSTLLDTRAKQPRLNVAARPHTSPGVLGVVLRLTVLLFRILRPIQREPVAHKPFRKVHAINRTYRNRAPVLIQVDRRAIDRPSRNEGVKFVRCLARSSDACALYSVFVHRLTRLLDASFRHRLAAVARYKFRRAAGPPGPRNASVGLGQLAAV